MANLTKHEPPKWQTQNPDDYPVYQHNGQNYRIVPDSQFTKLLNDKDGLFWLALGLASVVIAAATHIVIGLATPAATANQAPIVIEKPVVVTQEKVVPTNCIAFCNR